MKNELPQGGSEDAVLTRAYRACSASALMVFFLSLLWIAVDTAHGAAPDGARGVAVDYFESKWKPIAENDPKAFDVDGIDISAAALGLPFSEYILRGEKVTEYANSSDIDPRRYASLVRYTFPILVDGNCVGSIMVQRNRDENNRKFDESSGDFFFFGVGLRDNGVDKFLLDLRKQSEGGAEISWVQIVGGAVSPRFIIDVPGKPLLAGTYGVKPTEADAARLKAEVRAGRGVRPPARRGIVSFATALSPTLIAALVAFVVAVIAQRAFELALSARHARRLEARGAVETDAGHFPLLVLVHVLFPVSIVAEVVWQGARPGATWIAWMAAWIAAHILRFATMRALGDRWTVRIFVVPNEPLVRRGPYRVLRHPNYVAVVVELAAGALMFGAWRSAVIVSLLNAIALTLRVRAEDRALGF